MTEDENIFLDKKYSLSDIFIFLPQKYEKIYFIFYLIVTPYIIGVFFIFIYVANMQVDIYLSFHYRYEPLFAWAIGYEILATIFVVFLIIKYNFFFDHKSTSKSS